MHFNCERCGNSQTALLNGYRFGDVPLEGVWFKVTLDKETDRVNDFQPTEDSKPFFADEATLNRVLLEGKEAAQEMVNEDDCFTCEKCRDDVIVEED